MFELHPRLQADTELVGHLTLSLVLLSKDANYPWVILVPKRADIREIYELDKADRQQLLQESCNVAEAMVALFNGDKLNIATIGNMVPQLHMHHVTRFESDSAWPGPVWGACAPVAYKQDQLDKRLGALRRQLEPEMIIG
jgi:diadenosine tetraphosphate (Ap4A) HIT family hydrolase